MFINSSKTSGPEGMPITEEETVSTTTATRTTTYNHNHNHLHQHRRATSPLAIMFYNNESSMGPHSLEGTAITPETTTTVFRPSPNPRGPKHTRASTYNHNHHRHLRPLAKRCITTLLNLKSGACLWSSIAPRRQEPVSHLHLPKALTRVRHRLQALRHRHCSNHMQSSLRAPVMVENQQHHEQHQQQQPNSPLHQQQQNTTPADHQHPPPPLPRRRLLPLRIL
mmetsp:Transcript_36135/g.58416  ORF Transcript_36135/g.58416 Transcript_36135/m.58416 type:complete len:224 (+) Transcript_36135:368-1039(+)